jgi:hypothetical protein
MTIPRSLLIVERWAFVAILLAAPAAAQGPVAQEPDSARPQIITTLRSFYFNLAHRDWEAMAADILPAKVVAHRPAPETMVAAALVSDSGTVLSDERSAPDGCHTSGALADRATITLDGDWAEVSVPRCALMLLDHDEFRLIRFEQRWRIVYIDLYEPPPPLTARR